MSLSTSWRLIAASVALTVGFVYAWLCEPTGFRAAEPSSQEVIAPQNALQPIPHKIWQINFDHPKWTDSRLQTAVRSWTAKNPSYNTSYWTRKLAGSGKKEGMVKNSKPHRFCHPRDGSPTLNRPTCNSETSNRSSQLDQCEKSTIENCSGSACAQRSIARYFSASHRLPSSLTRILYY